MKTLYSVGEFPQVAGLSVKTPRFYHEKGNGVMYDYLRLALDENARFVAGN